MATILTLNGVESASGFLIAPNGGNVFPAKLGIRSDDGLCESVEIEVSQGGATIVLGSSEVELCDEEVFVDLHATSASTARDDTIIRVLNDGAMEATLAITAIEKPRIFFDGRFELRFSTGGGFYNAPRGGAGWMWLLDDEPDFTPADAVPDRVDKKPVGRTIRFHSPKIDRPHVPPIGVSVTSVRAIVNGVEESFASGDPVLGMPVTLGDDTYFASNQPIDPADRAAGRLPEERNRDGFQPLANFEFHLGGDALSGSSKIGPFVPGTTESTSPRDPDFRPRASGLEALNAAEAAPYPFLDLASFSTPRVEVLLPDYQALVDAGETGTQEFLNLQVRIGHLISNIDPTRRDEILAEHAGTGLQALSRMPGFAWGNKEVYRGVINDGVTGQAPASPLLDYLAKFDSFHFLGVFFNFHTDESRGSFYGSIDPLDPPPEIGG